jgi:starvation-inducible DNA-binding protein
LSAPVRAAAVAHILPGHDGAQRRALPVPIRRAGPRRPESRVYQSPSHLPAPARREMSAALNERLADGIDLHSQIKVAHWNIKGPQFAALHPLFETFARELATFNDEMAERAVTLGGRAYGTSRHVAASSRLPDYPQETTRDLEHVRLLAERIEAFLAGAQASRKLAHETGDDDTLDLFTRLILGFEKHAWFLRATLDA